MNGISVEEACKRAYSQLTAEQQASCPGVSTTTDYFPYGAIPVIAIVVIAVVLLIVYMRKSGH